MLLLFIAFSAALGVHAAYWLLLSQGLQAAQQQAPRSSTPPATECTPTPPPKENASREDLPDDDLPPLSVIVAARNEEDALPALLSALRRQTHPCFEVIVADDASTDRTATLVRRWIDALPTGGAAAARSITGRLVRIADPPRRDRTEASTPGAHRDRLGAPHSEDERTHRMAPAPGQLPRKKHALTQAIRAARHPLLAFTDADCAPPSGWLEALARAHAAARSPRAGTPAPLLIGYSPYRTQQQRLEKKSGRLLNRFARYETFVTGFLTAGACGLDRPYMAVGRNLSYAKALFKQIGGFAHSRQSMSGDDDLLVQEVHRRRAAPVRHVFGPATYVATDAPPSWRAWLKQKRRHASAGRFYPSAVGGHLTAFHLTGALLWLAPLALGSPGLVLLAGKLVVQGAALWPAARLFEETDLLMGLPLWELGYALYNTFVVPLGLLRLPEEW